VALGERRLDLQLLFQEPVEGGVKRGRVAWVVEI